MKALKTVFATSAVAVVLAAEAHAASLVTPNLQAAAGDAITCKVVNTGTSDLTVQIQVLDGSGNPIVDEPAKVPAGGINFRTISGPELATCRFVGSFGKSRIRTGIEVISGNRTIAVAPGE